MKWHPIEGDRQCTHCQQVKRLTEFSVSRSKSGRIGRHTHCKACRNERARQRLQQGIRKDRPKPGRMGETNPNAWLRPRDDRPIHEKLRDVQLGRWFRNVEPGQPAWRVA